MKNWIFKNKKFIAFFLLIIIFLIFFVSQVNFEENLRIKCKGPYSELSEVERLKCNNFIR